jgi:hypothetical protein
VLHLSLLFGIRPRHTRASQIVVDNTEMSARRFFTPGKFEDTASATMRLPPNWQYIWAMTAQRHEDEGITQLRQGIAGLRAAGQELGRPYFLALLAETYGRGEQVEEGMQMLTEALDITHKTGECMHQAELWRLRGELLLAQAGNTKG